MLVFVFALTFVVLTFLVDVLNAWLDPRIRLRMSTDRTASSPNARRDDTPWRAARRRMLRHQGFLIGAALLLAIAAMALLAPWLAPHDPYAQDLANRLLPPVWDAKGTGSTSSAPTTSAATTLSRLIYGARISLSSGSAPPRSAA
jgi:peptide/nickel transport system permease protein